MPAIGTECSRMKAISRDGWRSNFTATGVTAPSGPGRRATTHQSGGIREQFVSGKLLRLLQRAERTAALAAIEVVPIAGTLALQRDDAGTRLTRSSRPECWRAATRRRLAGPLGSAWGPKPAPCARSRTMMASRS